MKAKRFKSVARSTSAASPYFRRFAPGIEVRISSCPTGNSAIHFKKPFKAGPGWAPPISAQQSLIISRLTNSRRKGGPIVSLR